MTVWANSSEKQETDGRSLLEFSMIRREGLLRSCDIARGQPVDPGKVAREGVFWESTGS